MATAIQELLPVETEQSASTSIAIIVAQTPAIVLTDRDQRKSLYDHIEREIAAFEPDVTTKKGRDAIKALAFKITKTKTAIDAAGKTLNEEARAKINVVDEARRDARNTLDILADRVRKPLTEWEAAEEARQVRVEGAICEIREHAKVSIDDTAATVRERGTLVFATSFDPAEFGDRLAEAESAKATAIDTLKTALARLTKEEADRAELEKLRAAQAERDAQDAAEREARELAEAKRHRARQMIAYIKNEVGMGTIGGKAYPYVILIRELEEKIVVSDDEFGDMAGDVEIARQETLDRVIVAQRDQVERSRKEAEESAAQVARDQAEASAQAERDRVQREHEAEIAAERAKAVEADRLRQAEADRIAEVERQRAAQEARDRAEQQRLADEQAAREANKAHVSAVLRAAKEAIMGCGTDEPTAKAIVVAIKGGMIPNVTLEF